MLAFPPCRCRPLSSSSSSSASASGGGGSGVPTRPSALSSWSSSFVVFVIEESPVFIIVVRAPNLHPPHPQSPRPSALSSQSSSFVVFIREDSPVFIIVEESQAFVIMVRASNLHPHRPWRVPGLQCCPHSPQPSSSPFLNRSWSSSPLKSLRSSLGMKSSQLSSSSSLKSPRPSVLPSKFSTFTIIILEDSPIFIIIKQSPAFVTMVQVPSIHHHHP